MLIGIIGTGIVGGTIKKGFEAIGHTTVGVDKKNPKSAIKDVLPTEVTYICLPTPRSKDGSCDISLVEATIKELCALNYKGVIVIKSTVSAGTTDDLSKKYNRRIYFVPEFLRERCAYADFTEGHDVLIVGHPELWAPADVNDIVKTHGKYPKKVEVLKAIEAELCKYFLNAFNAVLITYANSFYDLCKFLKVDYDKVLEAAKNKKHIPNMYLNCNENLRGFGGVCLPKDVSELATILEKAGVNKNLFKEVLEINSQWKTTVPEGMRLE